MFERQLSARFLADRRTVGKAMKSDDEVGQWWQRTPIAIRFYSALFTMFAVGALLIVYGSETLGKFGEALVTTCVLAFTVDKFVKERLVHEVAEDIFPHI